MKKLFAVLLALLTLTACSANPAKEPPAEAILPRSGEYLLEKATPTKETWLPATLILNGDEGTFAFAFDLLSSFAHTGSYTIEDGVLTASTEDGCVFLFKVETNSRLTFCKADSVIPENAAVTPLPEGAVFQWSDREHLPEAQAGTSTVLPGDAISDQSGRHYTYEGEGFGGDFTMTLHTDGSFSYYVGLLSSYIGMGSWTEKGGIVTLTDETGLPYVNHFRRTAEDDLLWIAEGSSGFMYITIPDGARFTGASLLYGTKQLSAMEDEELLERLRLLELEIPEQMQPLSPDTLRRFIVSLEQEPDQPAALSWSVAVELFENLRAAVKLYYGLE